MTHPVTMRAVHALIAAHWRGLALVCVIAVTAQFLSEHYGGPAMLFALLIGMAFNFLAHDPATEPGVGLASRDVLRLGVALLGLRIAFSDIAALGLTNIEAILGLIVLTILMATLMARPAGRSWHYGALTGGAVAICGASAALAISAVLPKTRISERDTLLTVVAVTTLSTVAMVAYPVLFAALGFDHRQAGFLIGATIHDVAQVVGAGYSVSEAAGDTATIVKLMRVAMLPVVLVALMMVLRSEAGSKRITLPWFLVAFIALVAVANFMALPATLMDAAGFISRACLLVAVAALGVKTSLADMRDVGLAKVLVILGATFGLLLMAITYVGILT
ncbi:MAG: putative sulfate exporter family transporter [Rhizobiaceae bacterium]|nr:putative sulfate exporter family transporter [Rhizobiaceae bacterium]